MSKIEDELKNFGDSVSDGFKSITGSKAADAIKEGSQLQQQATRDALNQLTELNAPFVALGEESIPGVRQFKDDPSGANFLANNKLFDAAIQNTSGQIKSLNAARGKLNSGGTINSLFNNYLSQGDRFVNSAFNRALTPVTIGQNAANFQGVNVGNLLQAGANSAAAGGIGAANAQAQGMNNLLGMGALALGAFSDERLKDGMELVGKDDNGMNVYKFKYKTPEYIGYSAQEVAKKDPQNAFLDKSGYLKVTQKYAPARLS